MDASDIQKILESKVQSILTEEEISYDDLPDEVQNSIVELDLFESDINLVEFFEDDAQYVITVSPGTFSEGEFQTSAEQLDDIDGLDGLTVNEDSEIKFIFNV